MKKIFLIVLLFLCSCSSNYRYQITDKKGNTYFCNFYNETMDGCILFNDKPGYNNTPGYPTRLCGDYIIEKLK